MKANVLRVWLIAACILLALVASLLTLETSTRRKLDAARENLGELEARNEAPAGTNVALLRACADLAARFRAGTDESFRSDLGQYAVFLELSYRDPHELEGEHAEFMDAHRSAAAAVLAALADPLRSVREAISGATEAGEAVESEESALLDIETTFQVLMLSVHQSMARQETQSAAEEFLTAVQLADGVRALGTRASLEKHARLVERLYSNLLSAFMDEPMPEDLAVTLIDALDAAFDDNLLPAVIAREALIKHSPNASHVGGVPWAFPVFRPLRNRLGVVEVETAYRLAQAAALPWPEAGKYLETLYRDTARLTVGRSAADAVLKGWLSAIIDQAHLRVKIDLMRLGTALERHRAEHGAYPETLEALVPYFHEALPLNPCTGATYHYRRIVTRYKLFAIVPAKSFWERRLETRNFEPILPPPPISYADASSYGDFDGTVLYPEIPLGESERLIVWREDDWWECFAAYIRPSGK